MTEIIGVQFSPNGKSFYFDPRGLKVKYGQDVIVDTVLGLSYGTCSIPNTRVELRDGMELKKLVRIATDRDKKRLEENKEKEKRAFDVCNQKVAELKLDMNLTETECLFDGSKIIFYFTSDDRVDFRELVRDLAGVFHTRIEMRQIGARDEAKMIGGLGICGREFCCKGFLKDFSPVSIKMAKEQNLSLNPTKISGSCGRLMCCLNFENDTYVQLHKITPKIGTYVSTPAGKGVVEAVDLLGGTVKVHLDKSGDVSVYSCRREDVKFISATPPQKETENNIDEENNNSKSKTKK